MPIDFFVGEGFFIAGEEAKQNKQACDYEKPFVKAAGAILDDRHGMRGMLVRKWADRLPVIEKGIKTHRSRCEIYRDCSTVEAAVNSVRGFFPKQQP